MGCLRQMGGSEHFEISDKLSLCCDGDLNFSVFDPDCQLDWI